MAKTITVVNVLMDTKVKKFVNTSVATRLHVVLVQNLEFVWRQRIHIYVYVITKVFITSLLRNCYVMI